MALTGQLVQWNYARGFGFIQGEDGRRYFVHISAIGRIATRPRIGDAMTFTASSGSDGRPQARLVRILGANPVSSYAQRPMSGPSRTNASTIEWRFGCAIVLVILLGAGLLLGRIGWPIALAYGVMSMVAFLAYRADKLFAENGQWRISEVTLLALDLCLGVIGGLLGQAWFRHKTRKPGYVASTVLIAAVHLIWLGGLALGLIDGREIGAVVGKVLG